MKKRLNKIMSALMAIFMVLEVITPSFVAFAQEEETDTYTILGLSEKYEKDQDSYFSLDLATRIDKENLDSKDQISFALKAPADLSKLSLIVREDFDLFDDKSYYDDLAYASEDFDKLGQAFLDQGLRPDISLVEEDGLYRIANNVDQVYIKENFGPSYKAYSFDVVENFDFATNSIAKDIEGHEGEKIFNFTFKLVDLLNSEDKMLSLYKEELTPVSINHQGDLLGAIFDESTYSLYRAESIFNEVDSSLAYKQEEANKDQTLTEETPTEEPSDDTPSEDLPSEEIPSEDTSKEEASTDSPSEESPSEQTPSEEIPSEENLSEKAPEETQGLEESQTEIITGESKEESLNTESLDQDLVDEETSDNLVEESPLSPKEELIPSNKDTEDKITSLRDELLGANTSSKDQSLEENQSTNDSFLDRNNLLGQSVSPISIIEKSLDQTNILSENEKGEKIFDLNLPISLNPSQESPLNKGFSFDLTLDDDLNAKDLPINDLVDESGKVLAKGVYLPLENIIRYELLEEILESKNLVISQKLNINEGAFPKTIDGLGLRVGDDHQKLDPLSLEEDIFNATSLEISKEEIPQALGAGEMASDWQSKTFRLTTSVALKASNLLPIPQGWYFDIKLDDYLSAKDQDGSPLPINPLKDSNGNTIAEGVYDENNHLIRYTFNQAISTNMDLPINQDLKFRNIDQNTQFPIYISGIAIVPKSMAAQAMDPIKIEANDTRDIIESSFPQAQIGDQVSDSILSQSYPYKLEVHSEQKLLEATSHTPAIIGPGSDNMKLEVMWDFTIDTSILKGLDPSLGLDYIYFTIFGSYKQGLDKFKYKITTNKDDLDTYTDYKTNVTGNRSLMYTTSSSPDIKVPVSNTMPDTYYIRVLAPIKSGEFDRHPYYSMGLRISPSTNYIANLLEKLQAYIDSHPFLIPIVSGLELANKLASKNFNLSERMYVAETGLNNKLTDENFYYDNSRTIVSERVPTRSRWYALDLARLDIENEEATAASLSEDPGLENPSLNPSPAGRLIKSYYIPKQDGGYDWTTTQSKAMENGYLRPGTIVAYDYTNQYGGEDDRYSFDANIAQKKVFSDEDVLSNNTSNTTTEGGQVNLYSRRLSDEELNNTILSYTEDPYSIMRINNTFEMALCFNYTYEAPAVNGSSDSKIELERYDDPQGSILLDNIAKNTIEGGGQNPTLANTMPGGKYNLDKKSQEAAIKDLFERIYYYSEEVKKEEEAKYQGQDRYKMHRFLEYVMLQKSVHYYTDGVPLTRDFIASLAPGANAPENDIGLTFDQTLVGTRSGDHFDSQYRKSTDGPDGDNTAYKALAPGERLLKQWPSPSVYLEARPLAQRVIDKVEASYKSTNTEWEDRKLNDAVELVFFDHDRSGTQKLLSGHVLSPISIEKLDMEGSRIAGAEFTFIDLSDGSQTKWTSTTEDDQIYLRPGQYEVRETSTPQGYQPIENFNLTVTESLVNEEYGPYPNVGFNIKVHDGYETKLALDNVEKGPDGKDLVSIDNENLSIKLTNPSDQYGTLNFTKKDASANLDGASFRLRKLATSINTDELAKETVGKNPIPDEDFDKKDDGSLVYDQESKGNNGEFEFKQLPLGYYVLEETIAPAGFSTISPQAIRVSLVEDESGNQKAQASFLYDKYEKDKIIENNPIFTGIRFRKVRDLVAEGEESQALMNARFRLYSLWTKNNDYYKEDKISDPNGLIEFTDMPEGDYILLELKAPEGYLEPENQNPSFYGWKLFVRENPNSTTEEDKFTYDLYRLDESSDINKTQEDLIANKIDLDSILRVRDAIVDGDTVPYEAYELENTLRTVDTDFRKYKENPNFDPTKAESESNPKYIAFDSLGLVGEDGNPVRFSLYKSDFYGQTIGDPIDKNIVADKDGIFHLKDLEFNGYYILREENPPEGYQKASDIVLKVVAEAIVNEGTMRVIVRDKNHNTKVGLYDVFEGVVDYSNKNAYGKLQVRKTGDSVFPGYYEEVGLRRAYFRLYYADEDFNIDPNKYIQKVTPGVPIIDANGNPINPETFPAYQGYINFDQLQPGWYVLEEYKGPAGYERDPRPIYVYVGPDGTTIASRDINNEFFLAPRGHEVDDGRTLINPNDNLDQIKIRVFYNYYKPGSYQPPITNYEGRVKLQEYRDGVWVDVTNPQIIPSLTPKSNPLSLSYKFEKGKRYRLSYEITSGAELGWGQEKFQYFDIDFAATDESGIPLIDISNGSALRVYNADETGFRVPLRIEKKDKDKAPLAGAKFKARKLINGEKIPGEDIYPKYHDEAFDGFTEATGLAGDNYFRELTPGIYELEETEAPQDYKHLEGKRYFRVIINPDQDGNGIDYDQPADPKKEDYMIIDFDFTHTFSQDDDWNASISQEDKNALIGQTIYGLGSKDAPSGSDFVKNVEVIPDNGQSKPARPDAPYKSIQVVAVTNYKALRDLEFYKTDSKKNIIDLANFTLSRVEVDDNEKLVLDTEGNPSLILNDDQQPVYKKEVTASLGGLRFTGITEGTYILEETKAPPGYKKLDGYLVIHFRENDFGKIVEHFDLDQSSGGIKNKISLEPGEDSNTELKAITNDENSTSFRFSKLDPDGRPIYRSSFRLVAVDEDGNELKDIYDRTIVHLTDYNFNFDGLKIGRYKLTEDYVATGYQKPNPWYFNVVEDPRSEDGLRIEFETTLGSPSAVILSFIEDFGSTRARVLSQNQDFMNVKPGLSLMADTTPKEISLIDNAISKYDDGTWTITNHKEASLSFTKIKREFGQKDSPLSAVKFTFKKVKTSKTGQDIIYDANNKPVDPSMIPYGYYGEKLSSLNGRVSFENLSQGIYELEEVFEGERADDYNANTQRRWIFEVRKGENGLVPIYDKTYERAYYKENDPEYYQKYIDNNYYTYPSLENDGTGFKIVNIKNKTNIRWRKIDSTNGNLLLDQTNFEIYKLSDNPTALKTVAGDPGVILADRIFQDQGIFSIDDLERGVYKLKETKPPLGYEVPTRDIIVQILEKEVGDNDPGNKELMVKLYEYDKESSTLITDPSQYIYLKTHLLGENQVVDFENGFFAIGNTPTIKTNFTIKKIEAGTNRSLAGAIFLLSNEAGEPISRVISDENGQVIFRGLEAGTYELIEEMPPLGFERLEKTWTVTIDQDGNASIMERGDPTNLGNNLTVENKRPSPKGRFIINKLGRDLNSVDSPLAGAEFTLTSNTDPSKTLVRISDRTGQILFDNLDPGEYTLKETKAPNNYQATDKTWLVTVADDGITSVSEVSTPQPLLTRMASFFGLRSVSPNPAFENGYSNSLEKYPDNKYQSGPITLDGRATQVQTSAQYDSSSNTYLLEFAITAGPDLVQGSSQDKNIVVIMPKASSLSYNGLNSYRTAVTNWLKTYEGESSMKVALVTYSSGSVKSTDHTFKSVTDAISAIANAGTDGGTQYGDEVAIEKASGLLANVSGEKYIINANALALSNSTKINKYTNALNGKNINVTNFAIGPSGDKVYDEFARLNSSISGSVVTNYNLGNDFFTGAVPGPSSYEGKFPNIVTSVPDIKDAKVDISFNNNFTFVESSTSSWKDPSTDGGRWHSGYNSQTKTIDLSANELSLDQGQTAYISFRVKEADTVSKDTPSDLINDIGLTIGANTYTVDAPQVTIYERSYIDIVSEHTGIYPPGSTISAELFRKEGETEVKVASVTINPDKSERISNLRVKDDNGNPYTYIVKEITPSDSTIVIETPSIEIKDLSLEKIATIKSHYDKNETNLDINISGSYTNSGILSATLKRKVGDTVDPTFSKELDINVPSGAYTPLIGSIPKHDEANNTYTYFLDNVSVKDGKIIVGDQTSKANGDTYIIDIPITDAKEFSVSVDWNDISDKAPITLYLSDGSKITLDETNAYAYTASNLDASIVNISGDNTSYIYSLVGEKSPYTINVRRKEADLVLDVVNTMMSQGRFKIKKLNESNQNLAGAEFTLTKIDAIGNEITSFKPIVLSTGPDGIASFENIEEGTYKLEETKAPTGFAKTSDVWKVTVSKTGEIISVVVKEPDKTIDTQSADISNPSWKTYYADVSFGFGPNRDYRDEMAIRNTISETPDANGFYDLTITANPLLNYQEQNWYRTLTYELNTEDFWITYEGQDIYPVNSVRWHSIYVHYNNNPTTISYKIKPKRFEANRKLQPVKWLTWGNVTQEANYFASMTQRLNSEFKPGAEVPLSPNDGFNYEIVNEKLKVNVEFTKVDSKDSSIRLANAIFDLRKKDENGNFVKVNGGYSSNQDGVIILENLEAGHYKLYETEPPIGYLPLTGVAKEFIISEDGTITIKDPDGLDQEYNDTSKEIPNTEQGSEKFTFTKMDVGGEIPLAGVEFEILNINGQSIGKATSDTEGKVTFNNLPPGEYWIRETKQKDGYIRNTKPFQIYIGRNDWIVPETDGRDLSYYFSMDLVKGSNIQSTENREDVVYPNVSEGLMATLNYRIDPKANVEPGDYFILKLPDNVDIDGINKVNDSIFDIYGNFGKMAVAEVQPDRRSIKYKFTEAVDQYSNLENISILIPMFVDRVKVPYNGWLDMTISVGDASFNDYIFVDYDAPDGNGYIKAPDNIKIYQYKLNRNNGDFTAIIYVNPWKRVEKELDIRFSSASVINNVTMTTYKFTDPNVDIPWSFGIDFDDPTNPYKLEEVTDAFNYTYKSDDGNTWHQVLIPSDSFQTNSYVIKVTGTIDQSQSDAKDFTTIVEYFRDVINEDGSFIKDKLDWWKAYSEFYNPDADTSAGHIVYNTTNEIEYTKIDQATNPDAENEADREIELAGAVFELREIVGSNLVVLAGSERTSDANGKVRWEKLKPGSYQVWETKAPNGYIPVPAGGRLVKRFIVKEDGSISKPQVENSTDPNLSNNQSDRIVNIKPRKLEIIKKDYENNTNLLEGAVFNLYKLKDGSSEDIKFNPYDEANFTKLSQTIEGVDTTDFTTDTLGKISIDNLYDGTYYLVESKAPAGFAKMTKPIGPIKIKGGVIELPATAPSKDSDLYELKAKTEATATESGNENTVTVYNRKVSIPMTGGSGPLLIILIGVILMSGSIILFERRKRKLG
ncbi:MAG: SpaA isopeptide-forming pilin-related protein [Anaerococcus sp.]|nr:SpaA isopeptide-forming pilin-related protein [Anaerococcus sp.]